MMLNCSTLKEALEVFCRYHAILGNIAVPRWDDDKQQIVLTDEYPLIISRHYTEAVLAMLSITLDRLTENRVKPENIFFIHHQPVDITEHQRIFGKTPLFEQPYNGLAIDSQTLNMPILLANPTIMSTLEPLAHRLLEGDRLLNSWSQRCSEMIAKLLLRSKKTSLVLVARELSISPRHLQTKLQAEGISYQILLDNTRKNIALNCLKQSNMTMCEIALLLGLSEQSAFNHAFKRWTGMTPTEYSNKLP
jgi:AraC-like DNA-binding protein